MLVGGNLGFWYRFVVGVISVLIPPVFGLVIRHKWRKAVERREEIRRLCVLAAEEAALAELESEVEYRNGHRYDYDVEFERNGNYGYGYVGGVAGEVEAQIPVEVRETKDAGGEAEVAMPGRSSQKVMHPCASCSRATNQKCSRCKSVYYCSGKCQIIHWRQGHKDECQLSKREENSTGDNVLETGKDSRAKPAGTLNSFPDSGLSVVHSRKDECQLSKGEENSMGNNVLETGEDSRAKPAGTLNNSVPDSGLSAVHSRKDECQLSKREENSTCDNVLETGEDSRAKPAGTLNNSSPDSGLSAVHSRKDDLEVEHLEDNNRNQTSDTVDTIKDTSAPSTLSSLGVGLSVKSSSCEPSVPIPVVHSRKDDLEVEHLEDNNRNQTSATVDTIKDTSAPSTLSSLGVGLSVKSSSCEPSVPISDFWDGELVQGRFASDSLDDSEVDERGVIGSQVSQHAIANTSSLTRSQQTNSETKKSTKLYSHIEEFDGDVSRESDKSTGDGSGHVKLTGDSSKLIPQLEKLVPSILSNKVESIPQGSENSGISGKPAFKSSMQKVDVIKTSKPLRQHTRGSGTEMLTKYKGLFPYELFVKLYNGKEVEFRPPGFLNCGNSCYANVVLNCLASTPPLTSYFLQGLHSKSCEKRNWCFTCEFESLMLKAKDSVFPLSPIRIISHLQNIGSHLTNGREEDAHEFLRYAIDSMQSTCLTEAGVKESGSLEEGTTSVGLTFGGIIRSKIECMRCGGVSERQERMMDLTVEVDGHIGTLEEALKQYTSAEILDGDNKYRCGWCESYEKAKKKLKVLEAPNILTIALKRYESGEFGKLNKKVQFPEVLNLAPYVCGTSDKSPIYGLYGVIVHLDTKNATFSGHYVCYVKNTQNQWFKADDKAVKRVEIGDVLTKDAYMLLYARYSPRAPGLVRSSIIPQDPREKGHLCKSRSFSRNSWSVSTCEDPSCHEGTASPRPTTTNLTCGSSIGDSSFFSEGGSKGTESSNIESAVSDDHFDDGVGAYWNIPRRSSSDSDASSSSSSSSPLYLRQSPLADASRSSSMTGVTTEHGSKSYGTWRSSSRRDLENTHCEEEYRFRQPDLSEHIKRFTSSSRENKPNRLGRMNPFEKLKRGFPFRRASNDRHVTY